MSINSLAMEGLTEEDRRFTGSRFSEVRDAIFANPYIPVWGAPGSGELQRFGITFGGVVRGVLLLPFGKRWRFLAAARRTIASEIDLRWGPDRKGYQRLLHPNGICLTGLWEIDEETPYTGYFRKGSRGLIVARYSTCCSETRRGYNRSLALVGRVYPTIDPEHRQPLPTGNFISEEDFGGEMTATINEAVFRNAPNTTSFRRGLGTPILGVTGLVLRLANKQPTFRQVYQIAELGKADNEPTRAPEFFQLSVVPEQPVIPGRKLDFRDEIMAQIYDRGDPRPKRTITYMIETSDEGQTLGNVVNERREITNWRRIGKITFDAAVASWNGDHVIHFHHSPWRDDRNDSRTVTTGFW